MSVETDLAVARVELQAAHKDVERLTRQVEVLQGDVATIKAFAAGLSERSWLMASSAVKRSFGVYLHLLLAQIIIGVVAGGAYLLFVLLAASIGS